MADTAKPVSEEKLIADFHHLRNEQRQLLTNMFKLEADFKEHKSVVDTLKVVDEDRRCYRMVGGVLCARIVKDVLPELTANRDRLEAMMTTCGEKLRLKDQEIAKYIETHNIRVKGHEAPPKSADELVKSV